MRYERRTRDGDSTMLELDPSVDRAAASFLTTGKRVVWALAAAVLGQVLGLYGYLGALLG